ELNCNRDEGMRRLFRGWYPGAQKPGRAKEGATVRKLMAMLTVATLSNCSFAGEVKPKMFSFSKESLGKVPAGWKADKTGKGDGSVWKVVADSTAPSKTGHVLAQTAASPRAMFNLCVANDTKAQDVEVRVAFKAVEGEVDRG